VSGTVPAANTGAAYQNYIRNHDALEARRR